MNKIYCIAFFVLCTGFFSCSRSTVRINEDGVTILLKNRKPGEAKRVRLQVVSDKVIHVSATPESRFSETESLIAAYPKPAQAEWSVEQEGRRLALTTASLQATVSLETGEVVFLDKENRIILKEKEGGGKVFTPTVADGDKTYAVRQVFESPDEEAFYGLGQHQSDEFNYKGKNEVLYQYNTKVSVPFIVSDRNYGILWDNYSLTKFGDPRDYGQLSQFALYDKDGRSGGLTATYHTEGAVFSQRQEHCIDYENLETIRHFPEGFRFRQSSVVWEGEIEPKETGVFRFQLYYAGYTKLYWNGDLIVPERWRTAWNPNSYKFQVDLKKGERYAMRLEWKPDGDSQSYIGLKALSPVDLVEQSKLSFWSEAGNQIDYYFVKGDNLDEVISGYRFVTGKAQVMPKWAMGFWQSRERYKTQEEIVGVLKEFRRRRIPIDNIVQDWSYWPEDAWGSHDFDEARFPDPKGMVDEIHRQNARVMISVWPKFYPTTAHYKAFDERGWMYRRAVQDSVRDWIGRGYLGSFYDAYSEGARRLFWVQMHEKLYRLGFDAWWMDASEPDILSNASIPYRKALMNPTALGSSTHYFNAYGLMNAKGIYEGQRSANDTTRVFLLTRSGFAGSQRYAAAIWSGDIATRWEDMKAQVPAGLNFSMSGNPYWTMDNGGFCVERRYVTATEGSADMDEWRELNVRWNQFGAFAPLFRSHGQYPYRESWHIAPEHHPAYQTMLYYTRLRYRLMPYIYTLAGKVYLDDYTIMRPLVMDFGYDKAVLNIGDQYMFGPSILVCPVCEYKAREREVYFPGNVHWFDLYSGKSYRGGQRVLVAAPYERMPLFVAAGSILPVGAVIEHTRETQKDQTIYIYEGRDGSFDLYEDENVNYHYEKGTYTLIPFTYDDTDKTLTIGERTGEFCGMEKERMFTIKFNTGIDDDKSSGIVVKYNGEKQVIDLVSKQKAILRIQR